MAPCLLLLSRCCYCLSCFCLYPAPAYFLLCVLPLLLEPATETNTHIYQISMPQGLQSELHLAVAPAPHRTPCSPCHCLIPPPHPPCPLLFIVVAQNALQRFTVLAGGREKEASWRKLRRRNPRRPQCKAADKVFSPPLPYWLPPSLCRNLAKSGAWLGNHLACLGLGSIGCH